MSAPDQAPELRASELLAALASRRVQFLVIGGIGCRLHGATRTTKDLDICPAFDRENRRRLSAALTDLGAVLRLRPELGDIEVRPHPQLLAEFPVTHWRTRAGDIDVLMLTRAGERGEPVGYRELSERAVAVRVRDATILLAALEDIVRSKEYANRDKDREALPELRALIAARHAARHRAAGTQPLTPFPAARPLIAAKPLARSRSRSASVRRGPSL